jgi:hypothetical protein
MRGRVGRSAVVAQIGGDHEVLISQTLGDTLPVVGEAKQSMQDNYRVSLAKFTGKKFHIVNGQKSVHTLHSVRENDLWRGNNLKINDFLTKKQVDGSAFAKALRNYRLRLT